MENITLDSWNFANKTCSRMVHQNIEGFKDAYTMNWTDARSTLKIKHEKVNIALVD